jgi:putative transposase
MSTIQKAYQYRFYPTPEQAQELAREFGCARFVYNHFLRVRTDSFFNDQERIGFNETCKHLTVLKQQPETAFLQEVSNVVLQQSLKNLDTAFKNFFQGRAKYPAFKKLHKRQSIRYTTSGFRWKNGEIWLAKMDAPLNIRWSRTFTGNPSSITVSKDTAERYFISILVEEDIQPLPVVNRMVGIDLGLKDAVVLSTGERVSNPTFLRKAEHKLARFQRRLAKKKKGSRNRAKARYKVVRIHAHIADARRDWAHKLTSRLVNENQVISAESLSVKNMVKNHCLAKSISDVGWGELVRQLDYKAQWQGRTFVQIDRFYPSSKRCHGCGFILESLDLDTRDWVCPECGTHHDRDVNAARNILSAGLALLAGADALRLHNTAGHAGI